MSPHHTEIRIFFEYLTDILSSFLKKHPGITPLSNLFGYGGIFQNRALFEHFAQICEKKYSGNLRKKRFIDILDSKIPHDEVVIYGLSLMAHELLLVKKDPLVRILRYILYNYE